MTGTRSPNWSMGRGRLSERSQNPPSAVGESAMSRIALIPTRPARRRSRMASLKMKLSMGSCRVGLCRDFSPFVLYEAATLESQRAALQQGDETGLVGGEEHGGAAAPDLLDETQDLARHVLVQVAGRLVGQEQTGRFDDGPGQRGPLRFALGELVRAGLCAGGETHRLQGREGLGGDVAPRSAQHAEHA